MKCKDCPKFEVDGFAHCLLVYPMKPKQLLDRNEDADYCRIWEKYEEFREEIEKQDSGEKFHLRDTIR